MSSSFAFSFSYSKLAISGSRASPAVASLSKSSGVSVSSEEPSSLMPLAFSPVKGFSSKKGSDSSSLLSSCMKPSLSRESSLMESSLRGLRSL